MSTTIEIKHHFEGTNYYLAIVNGEIKDEDKIKIERCLIGKIFNKDKFYYSDIYGFVPYSSDNCAEKNSRICCIFYCKEKLKEGKSYFIEPKEEKVIVGGGNPYNKKAEPRESESSTPLGRLKNILDNYNTKKHDTEDKKIRGLINSLDTVSELQKAITILADYEDVNEDLSCEAFICLLSKLDLNQYNKAVAIYNANERLKDDSRHKVFKSLINYLLRCADNVSDKIPDIFDGISFDNAESSDKDMYAGLLSFFYLNGQEWHREQISKMSDRWSSYIDRIENYRSDEEIFFEFSILARHFKKSMTLFRKFPAVIADNFEDGKDKTAFVNLAKMYKKYPGNKDNIAAEVNRISGILSEELKFEAKEFVEFLKASSMDCDDDFVIPADIKEITQTFENIKHEDDLFEFEKDIKSRISDSDFDVLLEEIKKKMAIDPNPCKYRAAVELAIVAEKKNADCGENAKKIYSQCKSKEKELDADILFICHWALGMNKQAAAKKYKEKANSRDEIKKNLEWIAYSEEEQHDNSKIEEYKNDSSSAAYNKAEKLDTPERKIYWYFKAAIKGHPQSVDRYMEYVNARDGSPENQAYLEFVEKHSEKLGKNDGTLKDALWLDKAVALMEGSWLKPLPMAEKQLENLSAQQLESIYRSASISKNNSYYKMVSALAGEKYLMAYYAQKECDSQENYRRFIKSVDSKVLFSKSAKWPDELPVSENPADKASVLLSVLWDDYIKDEKLINTAIPEKYKHFLFYYALLCFLRNGELNKCAERIIKTLIPFPPASYLSALNDIENGSKNAMEKLWREDDVSGDIKCMAAFCLAKHFYEERNSLNDEYKEKYFNSLFKNRYYSYNSAKNINGFFDEIKKKIKEDKDRITDLPLFKEHLLPNEIINRIEEL